MAETTATVTVTPPATPPNYAAALDEIERLQGLLQAKDRHITELEQENSALYDQTAYLSKTAALTLGNIAGLMERVKALEEWREREHERRAGDDF